MAIAFDSLEADGKKFEEIYGGIIKDTYKAITAQPNVAANALLTSGTADYFVYEEGVIATGRFALGNRDPELGIKMVVNGTNQRQAELTDKQLEELTHRIQDNVDGQLGFSKVLLIAVVDLLMEIEKEKA